MARNSGPVAQPDQWMDYDWPSKKKILGPILLNLQNKRKIGKVIWDIGSGDRSVAELIPGRHVVITIDQDRDSTRVTDNLPNHVILDVNKLAGDTTEQVKQAINQIVQLTPRRILSWRKTVHNLADFMILSDLMNYLDYKRVIPALLPFLKPNGRILIHNKPGRGWQSRFHGHTHTEEGGVRSNTELVTFLESQGLVTEEVFIGTIPIKCRDLASQDRNLMTIVLRKS